MGIAFLIISIILIVGGLGLAVYKTIKFCKLNLPVERNIIELKKLLPFIASYVVGMTLLFPSIHWLLEHAADGYEWSMTIIGGFFFAISSILELESFILHYYKKGLPVKLDKILYVSLMVTIVTTVIFFFMTSEGFANFMNLTKPLANGISFTKGFTFGNNNITFYALFILSGAVFVYFLADHKMYLQYGKHGLLESTFLVAFPAGIIGARVAYVIGNWAEFAGREWWHVFAVWEGGLTILGGAVAGIVIGVLWYKWRHKKMSVLVAVDICAPVILIAQAIGRWGNFFNCEVYGGLVPDIYWRWLPRIIFNNMHFNFDGSLTVTGTMHAPLFLVEGFFNILGYCVLSHLFANRLKKYVEGGDIAYGYLIWYGFTRVFMEPLRDPKYNMGSDGYWSWFWSIIFVAAGILCIVINHVVRYFIRRGKNIINVNHNCISSIIGASIAFAISSVLLISGIILMSTNQFVKTINLNAFNIGVVCLVVGISCYFITIIPVLNLLEIKQIKKENSDETL